MKWTDGLKEQLTQLAFEEKSNKEIAEIMDIPLKEVHAGRSRFGITIAKVKIAKAETEKKAKSTSTTQEIKNEIKKIQRYRAEAKKIASECDELLEKFKNELFMEELVEIARS